MVGMWFCPAGEVKGLELLANLSGAGVGRFDEMLRVSEECFSLQENT